MFGVGFGAVGPYVDTSASIAAAERAVADIKPGGYEKARGYLSAILEKWKLDHGTPNPEPVGLLYDVHAERVQLSEPERRSRIQYLKPWECAGLDCSNEIDLFLKIWTEYGKFLDACLGKNKFLFFWFLGILIMDHRDDPGCRYSIVNAGQILLKIYLGTDKDMIEFYGKEVSSLTKKSAPITDGRRKGGAATAALKRAQGEATINDIHHRATELLKTKEKRDIAGIIKAQTNYSASTIRNALKSHHTGHWKKAQ